MVLNYTDSLWTSAIKLEHRIMCSFPSHAVIYNIKSAVSRGHSRVWCTKHRLEEQSDSSEGHCPSFCSVMLVHRPHSDWPANACYWPRRERGKWTWGSLWIFPSWKTKRTEIEVFLFFYMQMMVPTKVRAHDQNFVKRLKQMLLSLLYLLWTAIPKAWSSKQVCKCELSDVGWKPLGITLNSQSWF